MAFALHRRRLVGQRMPTRRKKRVIRDAQRKKPFWGIQKREGKWGRKRLLSDLSTKQAIT
ncbi:hypothetical protein ACU8V1_08365 [Rhizobium leguminosarum]